MAYKDKEKAREYQRRWYLAHKEEKDAKNKAWDKAHPEARNAYAARHRAKVKDTEQYKETNRRNAARWREEHPTYNAEKNRELKYNYLDTRFFKWEQVEGYDGWADHKVVHHRLEDKGYSVAELKAIGAYFNCCPEDLICMSKSEHSIHHNNLRKNK